MRELHAPTDVDMVSAADAPHDAAEIAEAVNRDDGGLVEGRREKRAGEMGAMMLDEMSPHATAVGNTGISQAASEPSHFDGVLCTRSCAPPVAGAAEHASHFRPEMHPWIARDGDVFQRREIGPFETRLRREG